MARDFNIAESWYEATAGRSEARTTLNGTITADVCVVGAGFAGLTTALELQRQGKSVVLLEASRVAAAASGRNGGFVSNGFALGTDKIVARVGLKNAQALYDLSRLGTSFVRETIAAHQHDIKMGEGWRMALRYPDRDGELKAYVDMLNASFGERMSYAAPDETRQHLNSVCYFHSLHSPDAFHIHPLRYGLLLAKLAEAAGARLFENTRALNVSLEGAAHVVKTAQGEVRAQHVVHCVASLDRTLHRPSARAILPVATYVAVTQPLQQNLIRTRSAVSDSRRAGDYYRLVDEGRILWGGRITTRVSEPARLAEKMRGDILSVYPGLGPKLGDVRIDYAWAGLMAYAIHKMPLIGRAPDGQWFATGFGGHGLNTSAMAGVLIAAAIARGDDRFRQFASYGPDWAYGPLGRVGVQGSYWWMQARDWRDERRAGRLTHS